MPPQHATNLPAPDNIDWNLVERFYPGGLAEEQRTKFRIFFAAARLFAHKGYNGTAVREIVEGAGVTKPTLYYYFTNKEDLYVQLIDMAMGTFSQVLERSLAQPGSTRDRLLSFFSETLLLFEANVDFLRLINLMVYAPRGAVPAYDLKTRHDHLHSALNVMLHPAAAEEPPISEESQPMALLLLLGLFRSMQVHLVIPEIGPPLTSDQISGAVDVILEAVRTRRPEVARK